MYEVALSVGICLRSGTRADVAWIVDDEGFPFRDKSEALAVTPGGGKLGTLLGGALDARVATLIAEGRSGRLVDVTVDEVDALIAGLQAGGRARLLLAPAGEFPETLWDHLWSGAAACLVVHLDGDRITGIDMYTEDDVANLGEEVARFFSRGITDSLVEADRVVTVLWPVPRLAIVGGGPICDALEAAAAPLGWHVYRFAGAGDAAALLIGFGPLDMVVVSHHDLDAAGNALSAALNGRAGYVGALGSPAMNEARLEWLTLRNVSGRERVYGPAGLDIGARRPAEVAIAVIAEALAVRSGSTPRSLRESVAG